MLPTLGRKFETFVRNMELASALMHHLEAQGGNHIMRRVVPIMLICKDPNFPFSGSLRNFSAFS